MLLPILAKQDKYQQLTSKYTVNSVCIYQVLFFLIDNILKIK